MDILFLHSADCTVERFTRFCFVVKTSADKMILQIFDIFSHELCLLSTQLTLFRLKNSIGLKKDWIRVRKGEKNWEIVLSADVLFRYENVGRQDDLANFWHFLTRIESFFNPIDFI